MMAVKGKEKGAVLLFYFASWEGGTLPISVIGFDKFCFGCFLV